MLESPSLSPHYCLLPSFGVFSPVFYPEQVDGLNVALVSAFEADVSVVTRGRAQPGWRMLLTDRKRQHHTSFSFAYSHLT